MKHDRTTCLPYLGQVESGFKAGQLNLLHHNSCQQHDLIKGTKLPKEEDIIDSLQTGCKHPYP